jgi:signal transduction histidine kinase
MSAGLQTGREVEGTSHGPSALRMEPWLIGLFTAVAVGVTAAITIAGVHASGGSSGSADLQAIARGVIVGIPLLVALYACQRPAHLRFGRLLLAVSVVWFVASFSASSSPLLYSVGRVAGWLAEVGLVYALLAFPSGRLLTRFDRTMMRIVAIAAATLYLPTALLVTQYPTPSPWSTCSHGCPHNAFMVVASQPAVIGGFVEPFRDLLAGIVFLIVAARLAARIRDANRLLRRTVAPVLVVAIVRLVLFVAVLVARRIAPGSPVTEAGAWLLAFAVPAIAAAFLVGLVRWHLFVSAGTRTVNARLREMPGPEAVQSLLADAFEDPGLRIASWSGREQRWIDAFGESLEEPAADSGRCLTAVRDGERGLVAIVHDVSLREDSAFVEAGASAASVAFASDRVAARTARMVRELQASRGRIIAAADSERKRIEQDLHDGAQQRLVALCIHLELAAERADADHPAEAAALRDLAIEVEQALEEIRALTHGIYPATLLEQGLAAAVRSAALRSTVPTTVEVLGLGEYPQEIAAAVYFCCVEALQNVAKHAPEAKEARIILREAGSVLFFSVSDDGPGLSTSDARVGAGMLNMRDRMATVGGQLTVRSRSGQGTRVSGRIPLSAVARPGERHDDGQPGATTGLPPRRRDHTAS